MAYRIGLKDGDINNTHTIKLHTSDKQKHIYIVNNNNITCIRLYATQTHGHKPYIQIHNTVIN